MTGFTFRDRHSSEFGCRWRTISRPILPTPKKVLENISGVDGSYDFSSANPQGRPLYEDRIIEGELSLNGLSLAGMHSKLSKIANWLNGGESYLIFDDMPGTAWVAQVENTSMSAYELGRVGRCSIYFRCRPFSEAPGILLDNNLALASEIKLGEGVEESNKALYSKVIPDSVDFIVGTPKVSLYGYYSSTFTFTVGGKEISFYCDETATLTVDFERKLAKLGDKLILPESGEYGELDPLNREMSISCKMGNSEVSVIGYIDLGLKYLYEVSSNED